MQDVICINIHMDTFFSLILHQYKAADKVSSCPYQKNLLQLTKLLKDCFPSAFFSNVQTKRILKWKMKNICDLQWNIVYS